MTKSLINYLTIILFTIPFSLLIVDASVLFPFITTKAIFFRILVSAGLFFAAWLYLLNPNTFPKQNYIFLAILLFFIANIISTILSVNPYRSFWGNAERMEGTWSLFFYIIYFFLLLTLFQFDPSKKRIIFFSFFLVATIISLMQINEAFFQKIDSRPSATLGNATYIGFMNLLIICLLLYFYFGENSISYKIIYLVSLLINLLSLLASQTRGSILGLLFGFFVFVVIYIFFGNIKKVQKILFFIFLIAFLSFFYFFLKTEYALSIPGIKRLSETLQNPDSVKPRLFAWKIFLEAFKQRYSFGWGPETSPIAFFSNFNPEIFKYEQAIFDKPHNKFIEVLVTTGIFGFISWLLIFLAFFYYLIKNQTINLAQKAILSSFIFAYLAQNFSLFDMQASYLLFFFGLSLITTKIDFRENKDRFIRPYLIIVGGLSLILITIHIQHYYVVNRIIYYSRQPNENISFASEGFLRLSEIAGPFLSEEAYIASSYLFANMNNITSSKDFFNFYDIAKKAYEKDNKDYRILNTYISLKDISSYVQKQLGKNPNQELNEIKQLFEYLINLYPNFPEGYLNYARFLFAQGEKEKAQEVLNRAEKIFENQGIYYFDEALLYFSFKDYQKAYEKLQLALKKDFILRNDGDFAAGLEIYLSNKDVENSKKIISLWLKQNNSSSTEEKIMQILNKYPQTKILKLDKR
jgi:O-antigen ligase